jgi:hypothetical protein
MKVMEQDCALECYNCQLLYPGLVGCKICGGSGERVQPARMADDPIAHAILKEALERINGSRASLVHALIQWQIYGRAYARVENRSDADREFQRLGANLVQRIRELDGSSGGPARAI